MSARACPQLASVGQRPDLFSAAPGPARPEAAPGESPASQGKAAFFQPVLMSPCHELLGGAGPGAKPQIPWSAGESLCPGFAGAVGPEVGAGGAGSKATKLVLGARLDIRDRMCCSPGGRATAEWHLPGTLQGSANMTKTRDLVRAGPRASRPGTLQGSARRGKNPWADRSRRPCSWPQQAREHLGRVCCEAAPRVHERLSSFLQRARVTQRLDLG